MMLFPSEQPKPSPLSATVLYDAKGDVGGGSYVHAFPIVSSGGLSSPFVQITVLYGGYRSFVMEMGCWLAGTCCWASSR